MSTEPDSAIETMTPGSHSANHSPRRCAKLFSTHSAAMPSNSAPKDSSVWTPPEIRQKGVEEAAGRDGGNLCSKIPGLALSPSQMLLHLFEKHGNRPARGVDFHHSQKGQRRVRGQKHAPLFLVQT